MITHITVENAAKLISRLTNANEMQALTYIREAADRGEIQAADALEKLQAELEQVKRERDAAVSDMETIMAYGGGNLDTCQYCKNGKCYARGGTKLCLPEWRGQKGGLTWNG